MKKVSKFINGNEFTVPRFYFPYFNSTTVFDLDTFSNASKRAFATVIYLSNNESSILVLSKTKVAPIQAVSIPRLELLPCLLLAESVEIVLESLRASLTICNIICWSESLDALHWIKEAHKKWKLFIQNKVEKIRKLTNVNMWRHCPGNLNPTYLSSRGTTETDFYNLFSDWNNGPTFLRQSINNSQ